ncbi:hypothetical protein J6590_004615 [Homalodisca vitripennis]|nr:hypothetical protein J6590_004615 [Homalodisca vitripennis]
MTVGVGVRSLSNRGSFGLNKGMPALPALTGEPRKGCLVERQPPAHTPATPRTGCRWCLVKRLNYSWSMGSSLDKWHKQVPTSALYTQTCR